jgi:hypothetical protein
MAQRREPRRLRQLPRAPHGAGRWRSGESPADSGSCCAPRTAQVDGAAARAPTTQTTAARPARRQSMAQGREPRRLRRLPRAPHGRSMARQREPRRHRQLPRASHGAGRWRRGESPADTGSCSAPRMSPVNGAAASASPSQTAAARPARRRSMAQRRVPRRHRQLKRARAPTRRRSMAQRREPRRLRQLPCVPHGASRWRSGESPADSDSCHAPRTAPVDGAMERVAAARKKENQKAFTGNTRVFRHEAHGVPALLRLH